MLVSAFVFFWQDKGYIAWARAAVAAVDKARSFMEECEAEATRAGASAPAWLEPVYKQAVEDMISASCVLCFVFLCVQWNVFVVFLLPIVCCVVRVWFVGLVL